MTRSKTTQALIVGAASLWMLTGSPSPGHAQGGPAGKDELPSTSDDRSGDEASAKVTAKREAEFKSLVKSGMESFGSNDFAQAAEKFTAAYEIKQVANLLYNIGRAYEQLGELEKAIETYDKFVVAPGVDIRARKDALERLKTLREILRMREKEDDDTPKGKGATVDDVGEPQKPGDEPSYIASYVLWGVGGAALIGSGVFALLTNSAFSDFEDATNADDLRSAASSGSTYAVVSDSLLIGGIAVAAVGTVIFFLQDGDDDDASTTEASDESARITPAWGPDGWSVGVSWRF